MTAFLALHVSVVWHYLVRNRSRDWWRHLVSPVLGFTILLYVVINAKVAAQVLGFVWLGIGALILATLYLTGRPPTLSGLTVAAEPAAAGPAAEPAAAGPATTEKATFEEPA
jgi:hypothetical protein